MKTTHVVYLAFSAGSLLISLATYCSGQSEVASLPFAGVGVALLVTAQFTRRASIAFVMDSETIRTRFGTLREAATLVAAVRLVQEGRHLTPASPFRRYSWVKDYLALLV